MSTETLTAHEPVTSARNPTMKVPKAASKYPQPWAIADNCVVWARVEARVLMIDSDIGKVEA